MKTYKSTNLQRQFVGAIDQYRAYMRQSLDRPNHASEQSKRYREMMRYEIIAVKGLALDLGLELPNGYNSKDTFYLLFGGKPDPEMSIGPEHLADEGEA